MRKLFVLLAIVIAIFAGVQFFAGSGGMMHGMMPTGPMPVDVAEVITRDITEWDEFSGRLEAIDRVEIRPRVAGTIESIHFKDDQLVKKGDALITIDPKPYEAALKLAEAAATYTSAELTRAKTLLPEKAISQKEFDERKNLAQAAQANLTQAKLNLGYTNIKAPISGRVSRAEITVGNLVNAGGDAPILTTIVSQNPVYASFDIDEQSYVRYLKSAGGERAKIKAIPVRLGLTGQNDFSYEGKLHSLDNELNTRAGTVRARAKFENKDGALLPGLFAHVRVGGSVSANALLINERAIVTDQNKKIVYVVAEDGKVEFRSITLGGMADGLRIVADGLKPGEKIVVSGLQRVRPGASVTPQPVSMETLEGAKDAASQTPNPESQSPAP